MPYQVLVMPAADKAVAKLPKPVRARIAEQLASLANNPRPNGSVKLKDQNSYRVRVGDYRIIYTIEDKKLVVLVIEVGHRRDIYR